VDKKGRRQAEGLVELLAEYPVERVLSSPFLRCVQSVEPLAAARGLDVEEVDELAEGATEDDVLALVGSLANECVALCTHGDVIDEIVGESLPKASVELLELEDGCLRRVRHLGRPA
jgi:8-oxo-dGTP diphosphatase